MNTHPGGKQIAALAGGLAAGLAMALPAPAMAVTTRTNDSTVSATVSSSCTGVTAPNLYFGQISQGTTAGTETDVVGTVSVTCGSAASYSVAIDAGLYPSGTGRADSFSRQLRLQTGTSSYNDSYAIPYYLYQDNGDMATYSDQWGDSSTNRGTTVGPRTAINVRNNNRGVNNIGIRARAAFPSGGMSLLPGTYSDTVIVRVMY